MNVSSQAAEEMIRMVYSGGMIVFRASKSALRTTQIIIAQLAVKHYKVRGRQSLYRMLKKNRTIQTYAMSHEQYKLFRKVAKKRGILYASMSNEQDPKGLVDVLIPECDLGRANPVLSLVREKYPLSQAEDSREAETRQEPVREEQLPKKENRSERDSRSTEKSSSHPSGHRRSADHSSRTTSDRVSVEARLRGFRKQLESEAPAFPAREHEHDHILR